MVSSQKHLFIVGLLPAVGSLIATPIPLDSIISLAWKLPFSLDIPGVNPDITGYCVGVVNSTSSLVMHYQCGITDTQYNYTVSPNDIVCDTYTFTVTPVNIVGNGEPANVTRGILLSGEYVSCYDIVFERAKRAHSLVTTFEIYFPYMFVRTSSVHYLEYRAAVSSAIFENKRTEAEWETGTACEV